MNLARVIGSMWATQKDPGLHGKRMMVLQPMRFDRTDRGRPIIALDTMDAGPGDTVIYATSSEAAIPDRKSTRLNSSHVAISYAVFCLKTKNRMTGRHDAAHPRP